MVGSLEEPVSMPAICYWCRKSIQPALLLMHFASKWPLPVTHSTFCAPEVVVGSFTLESNHQCLRFLPWLEPHQVTCILQQRNVNGGAAGHVSALIVKTSFSEMVCRAKLRRNGLYFQVTHSLQDFVLSFQNVLCHLDPFFRVI